MAPHCRIGWIPRVSLGPGRFPAPAALASGASWHRVRLEECRLAGPGEVRAGTAPDHLVVLNVASPVRMENAWPGHAVPFEPVLRPGCFTLYPGGEAVRCRWFDAATFVLVEIAAEAVAVLLPPAEGGARRRLAPLVSRRDAYVVHLSLALRDLVQNGHPEEAAYGDMLGAALAEHLVHRYASPVAEIRTAASPSWMGRVIGFVSANLERDLQLADLAREAGTSVFHFAHEFRRRAGISPHRYVLRRRIDRARALLAARAITIGEVAIRCGFGSQGHFSETFRRAVGMTPSEYRRASLPGAAPPAPDVEAAPRG
ncbi:MAG TPA: AraC family transcriptional regulator [Anaeromyxobacteraceae bacterium]|nr:AraC family transcriptional regulator [Anaeromyxobacteraceae bacterium]